MGSTIYPDAHAARDRWIAQHRPHRNAVDPDRPYAFLIEEERASTGEIVSIATVFLTNRECPWRCLMCDLWKNTLTESVPRGAIPKQIDYALSQLNGTKVSQIKLYNSGSFFDRRAIPPDDYPAIIERVQRFDRVIVECHPSLVNARILQFHQRLGTQMEVAMGLETVHPEVLPRLNKQMTLEQFAEAATFLKNHGISLRAFVLVKPPFLEDPEALLWAKRSVDFAFDCSATVVSLIPTRPGNGALEVLAAANEFAPPRLETFEAAIEYGIGQKRGRVFGDLWDLDQFAKCPACLSERRRRLGRMNHRQIVEERVRCLRCL